MLAVGIVALSQLPVETQANYRCGAVRYGVFAANRASNYVFERRIVFFSAPHILARAPAERAN